MKTVDEIRLENLDLAIARMGGVAAKLAAAAGLAPAYLSQIRTKSVDSKTGKQRGLGNDAARKIEAALGEAPGWMDRDHTSVRGEDASSMAWPLSVSPKDLASLTPAEFAALNTVIAKFVAGCMSARQPTTSLELGPSGSDSAQSTDITKRSSGSVGRRK